MGDAYRNWASKSPLCPPWLQGPWGQKLMQEIGGTCDDQVDRTKLAVKSTFPDHAPYPDGTDEIGFERSLPQGPTETESAYRARLKIAWDLWGKAGTYEGILLELKAQGFPMDTTGAHIVQQNGQYGYLNSSDVMVFGTLMTCVNRYDLGGNLPGTLAGWTFDVDPRRDQFFSQFGIVFPSDVAALRPDTDTATLLNSSVNKWKPVRHYRGAWVIEAGGCYGWPLTRQYGDVGLTYGGDTVHFIPPTT